MKRILKYIAIGGSIALGAIGQACAQQSSSLQFETTEYNFGTISEDTTAVYGTMHFTNRSDKDLVIARVLTSCSCVEAQLADSIVKAGATSSIHFSFKPLNFPGHINKEIYIYTDQAANTNTETLYLTGFVTPTTNPLNEFRYSFGTLYTKQKQIRFRGVEEPQVERISCYNHSDQPLSLSVAPEALPQGITFGTHPQVIPPHAKAEMVFSFNPQEWKKGSQTSFSLPLQGAMMSEGQQPIIQINIE